MIDYKEMSKDYYQDAAESGNKFRAWFHNSRHNFTRFYVAKYYKPGNTIADLGCGNVLWNTEKLPAVGVDINEDFLNYNLEKGTITRKVVSALDKINLPDASCDIVIMTEVLEHLADLDKHLKEAIRLIKPEGHLICSVPYDTNLSLWKPLFFIQCLYRGNILGDGYYKNKCGHINHFSRKSIGNLLESGGLQIVEQSHNYFLTIFTIAKKPEK